jgi:uncharacterized protein
MAAAPSPLERDPALAGPDVTASPAAAPSRARAPTRADAPSQAGVVAWVRGHPVVSYVAITYGVSWGIWVPMALAGARVEAGVAWPSHVPGLLGPLIAAFGVSAVVSGSAGVRGLFGRMLQWRADGRWYLVALSPLAFYAAAIVALAALGQGWPDVAAMGTFSGLPSVAVPVMWLLLLLTSGAEETGWRGFAAHDMLRTRSFLWTSVVIGLLWAFWHVPAMFLIENYRQMGIALVPMFTLGIVSGSILLCWLYRESGGSVFVPALWHGSFNLVSGTAGAGEVPAAVVSAAVMVSAVAIARAEVRRTRRERAIPGLIRG